MKYVIVDDEEIARLTLQKLCDKIPALSLEKMYTNAIDLIKDFSELDIDLIFLDIHLPELDGMQFLKSMNKLPQIIIVSFDDQYAIDAFEYNVTDYLVKPIGFPRLMKAVNKALKLSESSKLLKNNSDFKNELFLKTKGKMIRVEKNNILWVQVKGDYLIIQCLNDKKPHIIHSTLKAIKQTLPDDLFIQVHRSYIINIKKIKDIEGNTVVIDDTVIPIARSMKKALMEKIDLY